MPIPEPSALLLVAVGLSLSTTRRRRRVARQGNTRRFAAGAVCVAVTVLGPAGAANAATFTPLGFLPGHTSFSIASDVSTDGSVVVGYSIDGVGDNGI
ncbi:MAG: PEP-CTERM sorting domain-containing protein [Planctomycetota bacterium]